MTTGQCDVGIGSRSEELDLSTKAADQASLFDHLVGAGEKRQWHFEAERLRGLEVDHQVELGRLLHRQVGRLLALEDAIDVTGCQAILGFADECPISVMSRFAPGERFDGLAAAFKREQSFTAALRQFGVEDYRRMVTEVTARLPTPFEARLLKQPKSQPILACESIDVDLEGVPISYQVGCFSGERVALVVEHDQKD